jgi:hypothetical protein
MSVAADPAMPAAAIVVAGNSGVEVLKVKFGATYENFTITKLLVKVDASGDADSINYVKLSYKKADNTTEEKQGVLVGTDATFENLAMYVPKDGYATLTVKLDLNTIAGGADSGDTPQMTFDHVNGFEAVGADSGTTLTSVGSADITGNEMVVRKTKPTISLHPSSPSGSLVPGVTEVLRLNITADAAGDVYFDKGAGDSWAAGDGRLAFKVNSSGVGATARTCNLWDASDDVKIDEVSVALNGSAEIDFNFAKPTASIGRDLVVPAGQTKTVYVKCDLQEFTTTGDTIRLDLVRDTTSPGESDDGTLNDTDNVRWHDGSAEDINGFLVKNLDITGGTLVK